MAISNNGGVKAFFDSVNQMIASRNFSPVVPQDPNAIFLSGSIGESNMYNEIYYGSPNEFLWTVHKWDDMEHTVI